MLICLLDLTFGSDPWSPIQIVIDMAPHWRSNVLYLADVLRSLFEGQLVLLSESTPLIWTSDHDLLSNGIINRRASVCII